MALTKVLTGGLALDAVDNTILKLDDDYALTGTVSGTVSGTNAFSARGNADAWAAISDGVIVQFADDSTGDSFDTDSCYNTSTYKFTAPAAGVYMFWFSIYSAQNDATNGFGFLKNSAKVNFGNSSSEFASFFDDFDNDHVHTATHIIPLASGDTIAVCAATASDYYKGHSKWGGCRLA